MSSFDTSRQNPEYDGDDTMRDAMAIATAFVQADFDDELVEEALRNGLEGTDHTHLVYNLGMINRMVLHLAAPAVGMAPDEMLRMIAAQLAQAIEDADD